MRLTRSSIACARCRRSKVKCVNNGIGTTCRACETTGRECTYPVPTSTSVFGARRESGETRHPGEGVMQSDPYMQVPRKPRMKKAVTPTNVSTKDSMKALVDALDPAILTPKVWLELFDIWQLHYSTDLPFLHPPSVLQPLRQMQQTPMSNDFSAQRSPTPSIPPASPLVLLAFLALTARFHEGLVAHHSPPSASRPSNPLIACHYYAAACKARLAGNSGDSLGLPDSDRIQALAMLALHDWGDCSGQKAWIALGVAIRCAQALGLQYQADLDDELQSRSTTLAASLSYATSNLDKHPPVQDFVEEETKRRTFWGLFILDRYLSSGKYRPQMINIRDIRLQLPSSERSFLFGERVRTAMLPEASGDDFRQNPHSRHASLHGGSNGDPASSKDGRTDDDERLGRWEIGANEGVASRYIKAIDLYGIVIRWSCSGGRRRDRAPPWEATANWSSMNARLNNLLDKLPRDLSLSSANTQAHIASRSSTPFTLLHVALLLSKMMLHREYLPFIPLRCSKPEGPLDAPLFPPEQYHIPPGFWDSSAAELFRSARQLVDLVQNCREWGCLPQTPIVGFAIYVAAFIGIYAINFPWMDPNGYMCRREAANGRPDDDSGSTAARHALSLIALFRPRLKMADGWFNTLNRIHRYYVRVKKDFRRNIKSLGGPSAPPGPLSIQEGGVGGGLEEFKMIESTLKEFGSLEDTDVDMTDAPGLDASKGGSSGDGASTNGKSEGAGGQDRATQPGAQRVDRWNAINSGPPQVQQHANPPTTNGYLQTMLTSSSTTPPGTGQTWTQSSQQSPMVSPPFGSHAIPPHPPYSGSGSQHTLPQAQPAPPAPMTAEQTETWLRGLDTSWTGDDLTAFVEGRDWQTWANEANVSPEVSWLSNIWNGAPGL